MSYDEAVEAAAEAIGDVLGFEYSSLYNKPMARAALAAALPHLADWLAEHDRQVAERAWYEGRWEPDGLAINPYRKETDR